jgi:acyl-CoA reductase-like NAD-dependent aldehyde dehydrogenase
MPLASRHLSAAFTPWNFPINRVARKLCGALAAGCSIIVKTPEETPASPAELIRCFVRRERFPLRFGRWPGGDRILSGDKVRVAG